MSARLRRWLAAGLQSVLLTALAASPAWCGGPMLVGGPSMGTSGQPLTWDPAKMPIQYRVDGGPMATNSAGTVIINNAQGVQRVASMFQTWQSVSTAAIHYVNAGSIQPVAGFSDGDVNTASEFSAVYGSCTSGTQSPVIFDANGSLFAGLGIDPAVIGFTSICDVNSTSGHITAAMVAMNGAWQDGNASNGELTTNQFNEAITHELGHFSGLDHSQVNVNVLYETPDQCDSDDLAGLPLMFPILQCQARADVGMPVLAPDDMAWISRLYPNSTFNSGYGTISGTILFSDGVTAAQGVNVIVRAVDNPSTLPDESRRIAVSVVSGYRFTGDPGQSITANYLPCSPASYCPGGYADRNSGGSKFGSRDPSLLGTFDISVPPGTYTVEVESINPNFVSGSSVGPLNPPIALPGGVPEFWHSGETSYDNPFAADIITISPGQSVTGINIILNGTQPRFDNLEDGGAQLYPTEVPALRRRDLEAC